MTMIMTCTAMAYGQQKSNENHGSATFQHTMPDEKRLTGVVLETMNASDYTYMHIDDNGAKFWVATSQVNVKKGDKVSFVESAMMENFESKSLNRTFKQIMFADKVKNMNSKLLPHADVSKKVVPSAKSEYVLEGGLTVAELYAKNKSLNGKVVKLKGKVTKVSKGIMKKNWVHISDGTASQENDSVVCTTTNETPAVGDVVTVTGTLAADQDLGYGYFYAVIIEKSSFK